MVENTAISWNKLSLDFQGNSVTWHCEKTDMNKKREGHNVCWIPGSHEFKHHPSIHDFETFNFGKIQKLVSLSVDGKELLFARVEKCHTVDYEFGVCFSGR